MIFSARPDPDLDNNPFRLRQLQTAACGEGWGRLKIKND